MVLENYLLERISCNISYLHTDHVGRLLLMCKASRTSPLLSHAVEAVALIHGGTTPTFRRKLVS